MNEHGGGASGYGEIDLSRAVECLPAGVLVLNSRHEVLFANAQAHRLLEEEPGSLLGREMGSLWGVLGMTEIRAKNDVEGRVLQRHIVQCPGPGDSCFVALLTDVTELKRSEETAKKLIHKDQLAAVGQLAAGVAHEINNPAAFVVANLATLGDHVREFTRIFEELRSHASAETDPERQAALESILSTADVPVLLADAKQMVIENQDGMERIRTIVRDLRTFFRIDRQSVEKVDLNDVVNVAANMVDHELRHRARLVKDLAALPSISAERGKLAQVVINLLMNAAHAVPEGGADRHEIRITTRFKEGEVVLSVEDTGSGIPDEVREHIFKPFFTTKPRDQGIGLGLSICEEIVRGHRGHINFASRIGIGSRFEVRLPLDTGFVLPDVRETIMETRDPTRVARILVIDDEPGLLRAFRRALTPPHEVVVAEGGGEGLSTLERDCGFHCIICDLMMPEVDGPMVYEALREKAPNLLNRIVFCTGGAFTPRARDFLACVPNPVLEKPVNAETLRSTVLKVVKQALSLREVVVE